MCHAGHDNGLARSHVVSSDNDGGRCSVSECRVVVVAAVAAVAPVPPAAAAAAAGCGASGLSNEFWILGLLGLG